MRSHRTLSTSLQAALALACFRASAPRTATRNAARVRQPLRLSFAAVSSHPRIPKLPLDSTRESRVPISDALHLSGILPFWNSALVSDNKDHGIHDWYKLLLEPWLL